jgi:hypothetical protein
MVIVTTFTFSLMETLAEMGCDFDSSSEIIDPSPGKMRRLLGRCKILYNNEGFRFGGNVHLSSPNL